MKIVKWIRKYEYEFDIKAERFVWRHPFWGILTCFVGLPLFVLACVCASTAAVTVPVAWLFGWL